MKNVRSILFKEHEASFLVGALAALKTKSNVISFVGGMDIPVIRKFSYGYEQGAKYINPDISVLFNIIEPVKGKIPWNDVAGAKAIANQQIINPTLIKL